MKRLAICLVTFLVLLIGPSIAEALDTTLLHSFTGATNDGGAQGAPTYGGPYGSLAFDGSSTLYGSTSGGGIYGKGVVFRIGTDGGGFDLVCSITGGSGGDRPYGSVTLNGSTLYGTTEYGGTNGNGTVFRVNTDKTGFTSLRLFNGTDGSTPAGTPIVSGANLYGVTSYGGANNAGTIYRMDTNGSGFASYSLPGGTAGSVPQDVILSGATLYGMNYSGGSSGYGNIFKIGTDGSGYTPLHDFVGGSGDGGMPLGSLALSGSTLYGMTSRGGSTGNILNTKGTIFSMGTDGSNFHLLRALAGSPDDGAGPVHGSLAISGSTLLGMTQLGGSSGSGTLFTIGTDGNDFSVLHSFQGGSDDGRYPYAGVVLDGSTIYGMTTYGGSSDQGTVFRSPEPSTLALLGIGAVSLLGCVWRRRKRTS